MKKSPFAPLLLLLIALLAFPLRPQAQGYAVGATIAPFALKDSSGKAVPLADMLAAKAVVVVFTNPLCPYTKLYEGRLTTLLKAGAGQGVKYMFVNPTSGPPPTASQQLAATGTETRLGDYPYLVDEGLKVTRAFGATKTPEIFVLQPAGNQFTLRYRGAIDDNPQVEGDVHEWYLRDALTALTSGKQPKAGEHRAAGCMIKGL